MSVWGSFTGSTQRKDLKRAQASAEQALTQGYNDAQGFMGQAYDEYEPYANIGAQGQADNDVYRHAIGLGTAEERVAAQDRHFSDPAYERMMQPQFNAMARMLNARGSLGGGKGVLAAGRVANEGYQGWLDRVNGVGQNAMATGMNVANARAGIRAGQGDLAYGYGTTRAGNQIQHGNAMAQSRGILSNNLLNLAGTAAKAWAAG